MLGNHKDTAGRRAQIRLELGKLALRADDLEAAANHLEEAAKLDPNADDIAEKLAEVYATPGFREGQTRHKAGELFVELGRQRIKTRDDATGINYLRRAVGIDPYSKGSSEALEDALPGVIAVARARSRAPPPQHRGHRARRARRGAAPPRRAVSQPAARIAPALIEVLTDLVAYEQPGQQGARASSASCCATIRTGSRCRG